MQKYTIKYKRIKEMEPVYRLSQLIKTSRTFYSFHNIQKQQLYQHFYNVCSFRGNPFSFFSTQQLSLYTPKLVKFYTYISLQLYILILPARPNKSRLKVLGNDKQNCTVSLTLIFGYCQIHSIIYSCTCSITFLYTLLMCAHSRSTFMCPSITFWAKKSF